MGLAFKLSLQQPQGDGNGIYGQVYWLKFCPGGQGLEHTRIYSHPVALVKAQLIMDKGLYQSAQ